MTPQPQFLSTVHEVLISGIRRVDSNRMMS
jgi:hypothetical protein